MYTNKLTTFALLSLSAIASAHILEIPKEAWPALPVPRAPVLYETQILHILGSSASSVKWGECDSQKIYDVATGKSQPDPPQVGSNVGLNLDVIFNANADVKGIFVSVAFTAQGASSPITLYSQDTPATNPGSYAAGDEFQDAVTWLIPSFAPLGHYAVTINVHGNDQKADNYACLTADFDIFQ